MRAPDTRGASRYTKSHFASFLNTPPALPVLPYMTRGRAYRRRPGTPTTPANHTRAPDAGESPYADYPPVYGSKFSSAPAKHQKVFDIIL